MNRRVLKEIKKGLESDKFQLYHDEEGKFGDPHVTYVRFRPEDEIYCEQTHILRIKWKYGSNVPMEYPRNPPNVTWITPIYHANIDLSGIICLDILKESNKWVAKYGIETILTSLQLLMITPNTSSPLNAVAANKFRQMNANEFRTVANEHYNNKLNHSVQLMLESTLFQ